MEGKSGSESEREEMEMVLNGWSGPRLVGLEGERVVMGVCAETGST